MAAIRNLVIRFNSEADSFIRDLETAVGGTEQLKAGLAGIAVIAGAVSAATIGLGQAAVATGSEFEQLMARLKTTLGSEGAAAAAFKVIQQFSATTPFQVSEVTEAFISLKNRGIEPTNDTLRKLGDLTSSQGKGIQQIIEAVLDASTGEFERLKEFGIDASKAGDKVTLSFKGAKKTIEDTPQAITAALVSFGELKGVAGGMEEQARTLTGQMSNLADAGDSVSRQFYTLAEGPLKAVIGSATSLINTFLALPTPLQNALLATGALTGGLATLIAAIAAFELANGRALIAQTLLAAAKIKDLTVTRTLSTATTAWAIATGSATDAQVASAQAMAAAAGKAVLLAAAVGSLALVADTYLKIDAGARKIRDSSESLSSAIAGLAEVRALNAKGTEKAAAAQDLEAAAIKRAKESVGSFQLALDELRKSPAVQFLVSRTILGFFGDTTTAVEANINRQKVAFSDLIVNVDKQLVDFENLRAKGLKIVNKDELEAQKRVIEGAISALEASLPVDAADAKAKRERAIALQKAKAELDKFTAATKDSIKELEKQNKEFEKGTAALSLQADKRRATLYESLVLQGKDAESAAQELNQIEQQSARDRLKIAEDFLSKALALKATEKDPAKLEEINKQILSLEQQIAKERISIAQNELSERERLKEENVRHEEEQLRKKQEAENKAYEAVKDSTSKALDFIKLAQSQRLVAVQEALNKGLISEEQAAKQRLDIKRRELNDELFATKQQLIKLEALPKFSDPEREKQRQAEIRQLRQQTSQLTLQLLENELQLQEQYKKDIIKGIEDRAASDKNRSDRAIAGLEKEKAAYDAILNVMEQQSKLERSRADLLKAQNALDQTYANTRIDSLKRAQEIRKQLDDGSIQDTKVRQQLEKELSSITGTSSISQLDLIKRRQQAEDDLASTRFAALEAEQAGQKAALENEIRRNELLADRAVLEARIAEIRAKQQLADAETELQKARVDGDPQKIENAQKMVDLSRDSVKLAGDNVKFAQKSAFDQEEIATNSRQQLDLEQSAVREKERFANIRREDTQSEELVRAGGSASSNKRVGFGEETGYRPPFEVVIPSSRLRNVVFTGEITKPRALPPDPRRDALPVPAGNSAALPQVALRQVLEELIASEDVALRRGERQDDRRERLTPTSSPLAPTAPVRTDTAFPDVVGQIADVLNQLKDMNANLEAFARSPKSLTIQSQQPVQDAAAIWGDITRGMTTAAGLG